MNKSVLITYLLDRFRDGSLLDMRRRCIIHYSFTGGRNLNLICGRCLRLLSFGRNGLLLGLCLLGCDDLCTLCALCNYLWLRGR